MTDRLKPVLVLGMGRSGTTLLMQLLGTSPRILFDRAYPFEVRYLTYLLRWVLLLGQKWQAGHGWDPAATFNPPDEKMGPFPYLEADFWGHQDLWRSCLETAWGEFSKFAMSRAGAARDGEGAIRYYAEKIPFWVPGYLRQVMPYRVILLVRDPRDVFLSITAFDRKRGFSGFSRRADDDDWTFAARFVKLCRERFAVMREEEKVARSLLVKYESLVIDLAAETQRLSQWLGVELNAGWVGKHVSSFAHHMTSESPHESAGRWRRELSRKLNEFFLRELEQELRYFGYAT
jgi:hypothetical protein